MLTSIRTSVSRTFLLFTFLGLITIGCGDSNRSPFASTPVDNTQATASKSATDQVDDNQTNDDYEIPNDTVERANKPAAGQNLRAPLSVSGIPQDQENDNGIPAPEATTGEDEKNDGE